jgi:hypothetical protein
MLTSACALLIPIQGLLVLTFLMLLIDTIYAVYCVVKIKGLKSFKSALLRKGISAKVFLYMGSIIIMFSIDTMIFGGVLFGIKMLLAKSISMIWVYTELKSIDENSQTSGNRPFLSIAKEALGFFKAMKKEVEDNK